jgi:hypothetical protein
MIKEQKGRLVVIFITSFNQKHGGDVLTRDNWYNDLTGDIYSRVLHFFFSFRQCVVYQLYRYKISIFRIAMADKKRRCISSQTSNENGQ